MADMIGGQIQYMCSNAPGALPGDAYRAVHPFGQSQRIKRFALQRLQPARRRRGVAPQPTLEEVVRIGKVLAEGARCPALSMAIEKTHALASTWFCVSRPSSTEAPVRRHQDLVEVLIAGNPQEAAEAMRQHVNRGMENTMARLKPYFRIRKAFGQTYYRSEKRQKQQLIDPSALN